MVTSEQLREIRWLTTRAVHTGVLSGEYTREVLAVLLAEHNLVPEPGTGPECIVVRHPLGRVWSIETSDGRSWRYRVVFDPARGVRIAPPPAGNDLFTELDAAQRVTAPTAIWWDGRSIIESGECLGIDLEGTLVVDGEFSHVTLGSAASETGEGFLLEPPQIIPFLELQLEKGPLQVWCGWNFAGFDWPTMEYRLPGFRQRLHTTFLSLCKTGWLYDTMLFVKLWDIARYGQLFRFGGRLQAGPWASPSRGIYSLASQSQRWLGFTPPKGEGTSFGEYLGRPREIDEDQAAYALADSMIVAAIQKRLLHDPFTAEVATGSRNFLQRYHGVTLSFDTPVNARPPLPSVVEAEGGLPDDGDPSLYHPLVLQAGARWGWQTHTIQFVSAWAAAWTSANGIDADVEHIVGFLEELDIDLRARTAMFAGQPGLVLEEKTKKGMTERLALPPGADVAAWSERMTATIRRWVRRPAERDKPVDLTVRQVPARQWWRPYPGIVRVARHFPTREALLQGRAPTVLAIEADVCDDYDPAKAAETFKLQGPLAPAGTGTGQRFSAGDVVRWTGSEWEVLSAAAAASERVRIYEAATTRALLGGMMRGSVAPADLMGESAEEDEDEVGSFEPPEEAQREPKPRVVAAPFASPTYPFVDGDTLNTAAMEAYLRECVFPLPPSNEVRGDSPIDAVAVDSSWYQDLIARLRLKRDEWLVVFGVGDVDQIPDPVLREFFMLAKTEKERGAVFTYLPGYPQQRGRLQRMPLEHIIAELNLVGVRRARVHPSIDPLAAATTRSGQRNPNLQQVQTDARHRGAFVAGRDCLLGVNDVGGAEMATQGDIFAHRYRSRLPGKKLLSDYLNEGWDPHLLLAMKFGYSDWRHVWEPILGNRLLRQLKLATTTQAFDKAAAELAAAYPELKIDPAQSGEDNAKNIWISWLARDLIEANNLPLAGEETAKALVKRARDSAKPFNFGVAGGMQPPKIVVVAAIDYGIPITLEAAQQVYRTWGETFPDGKLWLADGANCLVRIAPLPAPVYGYYDKCFTLTGRLRGQLPAAEPISEWRLKRMREEGREPYDKGLNEWHNTQFQGQSADGAKLGLYFAVEEGLRTSNFVHDETGNEVPKARVVEYRQLGIDCMKRGVSRVVRQVVTTIGGNTMERWKK